MEAGELRTEAFLRAGVEETDRGEHTSKVTHQEVRLILQSVNQQNAGCVTIT